MNCISQIPLSMEFSRHEYWSGLPFPSPEDLPDPGIEPTSPTLQVDSLPLHHQGSPLSLCFVVVVVVQSPSHVQLFETPWTAALRLLYCLL